MFNSFGINVCIALIIAACWVGFKFAIAFGLFGLEDPGFIGWLFGSGGIPNWFAIAYWFGFWFWFWIEFWFDWFPFKELEPEELLDELENLLKKKDDYISDEMDEIE